MKIDISSDTTEEPLVELEQNNKARYFLDDIKDDIKNNEKTEYCELQEHIESCVLLFRKFVLLNN